VNAFIRYRTAWTTRRTSLTNISLEKLSVALERPAAFRRITSTVALLGILGIKDCFDKPVEQTKWSLTDAKRRVARKNEGKTFHNVIQGLDE
jgi:hypothetical protein